MKLSTRSRYGTRMVLDIALYGAEAPVRISDISKRQNVSVKYLEKLIRPLKDAGYVVSKRGPKGGHMLSCDVNTITVGEIVRLMEGDMALTECARNADICEISDDCCMRRIWMEATQAMLEKLDSITFADMIREAERTGGLARCVQAIPRG